MPTDPGTLGRVAMMLSETFDPLADRLAPERVGGLMAELGLEVPEWALSPALRNALGASANAAARLPELTADLSASIEADAGGIQVAAKTAPVAAQVAVLVDSANTIAAELRNLGSITGVTPAAVTSFANELPGRLVQLLVVEHIERNVPSLAAVLSLFGIVEHRRLNVGSTEPRLPQVTRRSLRLDRLGTLIQSPDQLMRDEYGWGTATLNGEALIARLGDVLAALRLPVTRFTLAGPPPRPALQFPLAQFAPTAPGVTPPGLEAKLVTAVGDGFNQRFPISDGLEFELGVSGAMAADVGVTIQPPAAVTVIPPSGSVQGEVRAGLAHVPRAPSTVVQLLGAPGGSRLEAGRIGAAITAAFAWEASGRARGEFGIEGRLERGKLVISLAGADGFIGSLMGNTGLEADFDLGFGWRAGSGFYFTGSGGLQIRVPTHIELGPVELRAVTVEVGMRDGGFPIALTTDVKGSLGPLTAVVERIGAEMMLKFPADQSGNLGIADIGFGFKPPTGVGLAIDVAVVRGGGYLSIDTARGEYAGALELEFAKFLTLKAIGIITTRMPDGSPGFSLLIIITADFGTGIQLSFGFVLLAVGGLLGLNRTMNLQALMEGVRSGAVQSVMFPRDVIANAPRIISDLRTLFPPQEGKFLIGPMVKLGWGTPALLTGSLGVIVEIPGNIAIVGVIKLALPTEQAAILVLQVNFAGAIEFDKKRLFFFASLFESRILFMTIEGELGLLVAWGSDANFVLSVGGFHPQFTPPPLPFPSPRRVAIDILNRPGARIQVSGYFAVTSNTAQFGARAELYFGFSAFNLRGHIGFDALFRFGPFSFEIAVSASVSLDAFGVGVFSIRLRFTLEGPTPFRAHGTGSISVFLFEVSADFDITWGETRHTALDPVDVMPIVAGELEKPEAWKAQLPVGASQLVSLRKLPATDDLVLHPVGTLEVRQRAVPLDLTLDRVGNQRPRDANRFTLSVLPGSLEERRDLDERFPLAQFKDMDDAAKLSQRPFDDQHGGIELSVSDASTDSSRMVKRVVRYEVVIIDNRFRRRLLRFRGIMITLFTHFLAGNSVSLSGLSKATQAKLDPFDDRIKVNPAQFAVASAVDNKLIAPNLVFASQASANEHVSAVLAANPTAALHVIPAAELNQVGG
jgi:hypothetical protein